MSFPRATALGLTFALATAALGQEEAPAPTPSLAGTVEDRDGYAVEGAVVIAYSPTASFDEPPLTARTDRNGRFQLELKDSPFWNVSVRATGHVPWSQRRVAPGAALRIVLQKGSHAIEGTVLDGHTLELIAGARVELLEGGRGFRLPPVTLELEPIATSTGEEGEFHFDGLSAARASVAATARGYGRSVRRDVAPGEPLQLFLFPDAALSGRVLIDDDTPLEGALVQALPESGRRFRMARGRIERTTKDSLFKLLGLASGRYHVLVRHEDLAPQIIPDVEIEKEATVELDVYLSPGTRISDRLVDEDERPITGRVAITTLDGVQLGMALGSEFVAPSDGEGVFVLPSLPRGRHDLNVVASGFVQQDVEVEISDKDVELDLGDIVLETGLAIRGYVVDKEDVAIPGAELRGFASMRRRVGARFGRDELKATTDADGSFVLAGLEPGHYGLFVQAPGYGFSGRELVEAGTDDVKLVLEPAGTIVGSIVDPDERPLLSVSVSVRPASRQGRGGAVFATSDAADDTFLIEDVVKGTYVLEVIAPDFLPEVVSNVDVTPGAETDVGQLQLRRGALVRRTVLDPSGQPVAGATVRANTPGEQRMAARDNFAVSDTDGFFSIEGLRDGPLELVGTHPNYAEGRAGGIEIQEAIGVVLQWGGNLEGYVRTHDGMGLSGRFVRVWVETTGTSNRFGLGNSSRQAQTGSDGYFFVEHLPLGPARVDLFGSSEGIAVAVQSQEIEIWEGDTAYVEFETRQVLVQGQVTRNGAPLSGAQLVLRPKDGPRGGFFAGPSASTPNPGEPQLHVAETRADGSFELFVEQPGDYTANVGLADITTRLPDETIHIPDIDVYAVTIDFGGAVVQGIVVDKETEEPVATVFVVARPSESSSGLSASSSMTRADGAFELELNPGVYELQTRADGYATGEHPIDVRGESSSSSIRIALEPARAIHGRVVDSQGRAMAGMLVIATESDAIAGAPTTGGRARTLGDGSFRVEQLARKTYNLLTGSELAGYGFRRNVRPGASEVDLALAPGGRVVVFARGEDGEPIDRVNITLTAIDGAPIRDFGTSTRSDGTATLSLPSGNLELMAVKDDLQSSTVVTVQPGADVPVEIRLVRRPR